MNHFRHLPRSVRSAASLLSLASALLALPLTACGSASDTTPAATGSAGATGVTDVGKILSSVEPCTKPNTVCMSMQVPDTMTEQPVSLMFELYDSASAPNHPPNGYAGVFTAPKLTPGEMIHVELSDDGMQGDYWMWTLMYMPGGGHGAPIVDVDYRQLSLPAALHLDGTPLNITDPVILTK